jgi:hypothetical protein
MKLNPNFRPEVKEMLDNLLLHISGVQGGKSFGFPAYRVGGKVFAFVGGQGVGIKLTEVRVRELLAQGGTMHPFEPAEGIVWKEWVTIILPDVASFQEHAPLLDESIQFVAGSSK